LKGGPGRFPVANKASPFVEAMKTYRREFIRKSVGLGAVLSTGGPKISGALQAQPGKSRVVIGRGDSPGSVDREMTDQGLLDLLDRSMQSLYSKETPLEAWRLIGGAGQVVGLKVNCLAGKGISTHPRLVEAISERLQQAGVKSSDIVIWDRLNRDLERAGFSIKESGKGPLCFGNDHLGFGRELETFNAVGSLMCRTLTEICDVVINLPVLKDHGITGVTMAMKNLFGAIHNPNKYHLNIGDPYVADVYMLPPIRQKVQLTVCDAIAAQYEGGPSFMPQWTWSFNGLILGFDPVALDYTGWQIIERKRAEMGMPSLRKAGREPTYIATAADPQHRIGTCNPDQIEVMEI